MKSKKEALINYYETCESDYRRFWDLERSMAMHAGFWDEKTKTLPEALKRENEMLAEFANITEKETILDVGCGVGGSSIYLAEQFGCRVIGITISEKQVKTATANAQKLGVASLATFECMDFCHTTFPDQSFDLVWGVESICHAENKEAFVCEAYRLLKKGGRLVVADGFAIPGTYGTKQAAMMKTWQNGWGVEAIEEEGRFRSYLEKVGFEEVSFKDMTSYVLPSSKRLYMISLPTRTLSKLGEWIGLRKKIQTDNIRGAYYQYKTLKQGLWKYGVFIAHKLRIHS